MQKVAAKGCELILRCRQPFKSGEAGRGLPFQGVNYEICRF